MARCSEKSELLALGFEPSPVINEESDNKEPLGAFDDMIGAFKTGQLGVSKSARSVFFEVDGLTEVLLDPRVDEEKANSIAKLPDLVANSSRGSEDVDTISRRVSRAIKFALFLTQKRAEPDVKILTVLVDSFCVSNANTGDAMEIFALGIISLKLALDEVILGVSPLRREAVLRPLVQHSSSSRDLGALFKQSTLILCWQTVEGLLLRRGALSENELSRFVTFLADALKVSDMFKLLIQCLRLWSDPVIAKAYVKGEVIHYTRLSVLVFYNVDKEFLVQNKDRVVEHLVRGLPNHFHSSDGRTLELAKFFSELVTSEYKRFEPTEEEDKSLPLSVQNPKDELSRSIVKALMSCPEKSSNFWFKPFPLFKNDDKEAVAVAEETNNEANSAERQGEQEEELPTHRPRLVYLRHFLEKLPEFETWDEIDASFDSLPEIIEHQLTLEHPKTATDLIDLTFSWENKFGDADLDLKRKQCLKQVLVTRPERQIIQHFTNVFFLDQLQGYRKNLVLEVLSETHQELELKDLRTLARCSFDTLLHEPNIIQSQEVLVRIPMILYFTDLISVLPKELLEESMVVRFLGCITQLRDLDSGAKQTVRYSIGKVLESVKTVQYDVNLNNSLIDTKQWLSTVYSQRDA